MIWQPKPKQQVRIHYRKTMHDLPCHGKTGVVILCGNGRGPRNVLIALSDTPDRVVVPRGNLVKKIVGPS